MRRHTPFVIALASALLIVAGSAHAQAPGGPYVSPLQGGHYIPSLMNLRDLTTPAPGFYVLWYNALVWSNSYYDQNGNKVSSINLSKINPKLPNLPVSASQTSFLTTPTLVYAPDWIFFGARYFALVSLPFVTGGGSLSVDSVSTGELSADHSVTGFSDMSFIPVGLSWSFKCVELTFDWMVVAPTGRYGVGGSDNTGLGFWTNTLQLFAYWFPGGSRDTAIQLGMTYEINSAIKGADVTPGQRFTLQYGVDHYFTEALLVGLQGGNSWQVTDDTGSAVYWNASVHDRNNFWAVSAGYWVWQDRLMVNAKYVQNYGAVQHFGNHIVYLNLIFNSNWLTGRK